MRSQTSAAENLGRKSRHFRFANVCSANFRLKISKFMSCKHFQREVSVKICVRKCFVRNFSAKKCVHKRLQPQTSAKNRSSSIRKRLQPQTSADKLHLKPFEARTFGQKMRSQTFAAENLGRKSRHFRFASICSANFRRKSQNA